MLQKRRDNGAYKILVKNMEENDPEWYFDYFRLSPEQFNEILSLVKNDIKKEFTSWREPISTKERLAITLRYLATGESRRSLSAQYLVGRSTISKIICETTEAIWINLKDTYMKSPTKDDFKNIAGDFKRKWDFPNCLGAIDGKHIRIKCPDNSGSKFYSYKKFFSVVLMAVVDANYKFCFIDVGAEGSAGDSGVFGRSGFGNAIIDASLDVPEPKALGTGAVVPYVFVADEAFPLKCNILKPFPGGLELIDREKRIFNYRLSRARMVVENAFGILAARWRIFHSPIDSNIETVKSIIKACCCLHNFIITENQVDPDLLPSQSKKEVPSVWGQRFQRQGSNNYTNLALQVRNKYKEYFCSSEGLLFYENSYLFE